MFEDVAPPSPSPFPKLKKTDIVISWNFQNFWTTEIKKSKVMESKLLKGIVKLLENNIFVCVKSKI